MKDISEEFYPYEDVELGYIPSREQEEKAIAFQQKLKAVDMTEEEVERWLVLIEGSNTDMSELQDKRIKKLKLNTDQERVMYYVLSSDAISILKLRMQGQSYEKIAENLGVSKTAVWRRVDRSIKKIDQAIMREKLRNR